MLDALTPRALVALLIFIATYGALAFRNVRPSAGIPIWLILLVGAAAMVFTGSITVQEAYTSINLQVIVFLFSMFVLVTALDISGLLERFATSLLLRAKKPQDVIYLTFFGFAFLSSFLMNDTIALMGAPVMMMLAKKMKVSPRPLFFILAFSITIGSTTTPMGNPQNLLVAIGSGMPAPVITFARYLLVPTLLNLIATYFILKLLFGKELEKARPGFDELIVFEAAVMKNNETKQRGFGRLSLAVVLLTLGSIILVNVLETFGVGVPFRISEVSFFGAALLLATSDKSREIVARIDWGILVLFASLFVLTQAVSENGIIAQVANNLPVLNSANPHSSVLAILISSTVLSQAPE